MDESNCISWAENTEELPSKYKHTAIKPLKATESTLKGKSITMLTIHTENVYVLLVVRVVCMCRALAIMSFKSKCFVSLDLIGL